MSVTDAGQLQRADRSRQIAVTISEIVCVLGTLVGVGVFGGPQVQQAAGGALSADATLLAPAAPAFSIWSVIYLGLAAFTVWQWLPAQAGDARQRRIGWLAAGSMVLNAAWLLVVQAGLLWLSVVVILALVLVLGTLVQRLAEGPPAGRVDAIIVDCTFGLYVGWVSVAVCANITATLVNAGVRPSVAIGNIAAVVVLAVAVLVAALLARATHGNLAIGAAMVWGIGWIAVARATGSLESLSTALAAVAAALVIGFIFVMAWRRA